MSDECLILVDENDQQWGKMEKLKVHQLGLLHRAFSIFIFNSEGQVLLQQRAADKYHSPNLWSNTCCSHPHFGESMAQATKRRLQEEMGMNCPITFAFKFTYKVDFSNGLIEHECDHVYLGYSDAPHKPIPWRFKIISTSDLMNSKKTFQNMQKIIQNGLKFVLNN